MGESNGTRRAPRKLSAEQKWEVFLQVTSKELTQAESGPQVAGGRVDGDRDRAHGQGRVVGRAVPGPGAAGGGAELRVGSCTRRGAALTEAVKAQAIELAVVRGKAGWAC